MAQSSNDPSVKTTESQRGSTNRADKLECFYKSFIEQLNNNKKIVVLVATNNDKQKKENRLKILEACWWSIKKLLFFYSKIPLYVF